LAIKSIVIEACFWVKDVTENAVKSAYLDVKSKIAEKFAEKGKSGAII